MDKLEILNTKLTAINDEIRELSGSEEKLGLEAMAEKVSSGNDEIALQTELLEQAYAELQGKVDPELYENGYTDGYAQGDIEGQVKGYDKALAEGYIKPSGTLEITENNKEYNVAEFEKANVKIPLENKLAQLMNKTITEGTEEDFDGATEIGRYVFYYCEKLESVNIPDSVMSIGTQAFYHCSKLTSITIPDSVTSIGNDAFAYCSNLESIDLPSDLTTIVSSLFQSCVKLSSITIPSKVTNIKNNTFYDCKNLKSIILEPEPPPTLNSSSLLNGVHADCCVYVPSESLEAYKTATNWSAFADRIFAIEEAQ
jgi:hypothetical protein